MRPAGLWMLTAVLLLGSAVSCRPPAAAPSSELRTVVLVTLDTWRWDANGFLGDPAASPTPFVDQLATGGFVATHAMTPVPLTRPSHWSLLTGDWPWRSGLRTNADSPGSSPAPTLPGVLAEHGFKTAAFVSSAVLDGRDGYSRGFDVYDDRMTLATGEVSELTWEQRRGDQTVAAAVSWIGRQEATDRVFLWVHLFEPHFPYEPPDGAWPGEHGLYRGEVAFADRQVRALAQGLETAGRPWRQVLWVVLADHGEALGEHGEATHGFLLHRATTRIPLVIFGPGVPATRSGSLASTVDVAPTVLSLLGISAELFDDGLDLLAESETAGERSLPLEAMEGVRAFSLAPVVGLRRGRWLWEASPADHLWDLVEDPGEERDIAAEEPDLVAELRRQRRRFGIPALSESEVDPYRRRQLRALGYLTGGRATDRGVREFVQEDLAWYGKVLEFQRRGDLEQAESWVLKFLERNPESPSIWVEAGFIAVRRGETAEAEARFERALELAPDDTQAQLNLANVFLVTGRLEEAEGSYRRVLQSDPEDAFALYNLGLALSRLGRHAEAAEPWRQFLRLYPQHGMASDLHKTLKQWETRGLI